MTHRYIDARQPLDPNEQSLRACPDLDRSRLFRGLLWGLWLLVPGWAALACWSCGI